jgi:chaperonin GroEL (HSP60 family)
LKTRVAEIDNGVAELAEDLASKIEDISGDGATAALVATHTSDCAIVRGDSVPPGA